MGATLSDILTETVTPTSNTDAHTIALPIPSADTSSSVKTEQPNANPPATTAATGKTESVPYALDTYNDDSDSFSETDMRPAAIKSRVRRIARRAKSMYQPECIISSLDFTNWNQAN